jgi:crossover junction endodeoxyribonuclease RuvC
MIDREPQLAMIGFVSSNPYPIKPWITQSGRVGEHLWPFGPGRSPNNPNDNGMNLRVFGTSAVPTPQHEATPDPMRLSPDQLAASMIDEAARMSGAVIGIDVGVAGALALVGHDGALTEVVDMPTLRDGPAGRSNVNAPLLAEIVAKWHARSAFVEFVGARPGEGAVGAFAFGRSRGVIEGAAGALGVSVAFITPPVWKRLVGIPPGKDGAKDAARAEAIRRWPDHAALFARVKDDGRAESALIAVAGLMREARNA